MQQLVIINDTNRIVDFDTGGKPVVQSYEVIEAFLRDGYRVVSITPVVSPDDERHKIIFVLEKAEDSPNDLPGWVS